MNVIWKTQDQTTQQALIKNYLEQTEWKVSSHPSHAKLEGEYVQRQAMALLVKSGNFTHTSTRNIMRDSPEKITELPLRGESIFSSYWFFCPVAFFCVDFLSAGSQGIGLY